MTAPDSGSATITQEKATVGHKRLQIPAIYFALTLLVVLVILFTLGNQNFLSAYNLNTIGNYAAILSVVALGQMNTILIGGIDLSVGGLMSFTSVLFVVLLQLIGVWAFPICILVALAVGYVNGVILTRIKIPSFIATLGTGGILTSLALLVSPLPVVAPGSKYGLLDLVNGNLLGIPNLLLLALAAFVLFYITLRFTKIGRNIYYVGSNIKMSWMSGIDIVGTRNLASRLETITEPKMGSRIPRRP
jgi:ribose transport system permease protein